jgi:hypothetical protein
MIYGINERATYSSYNMTYRLHSEEVAIGKLMRSKYRKKDIRNGIVAVNVAITKSGLIRQSKPCARCCKCIQRSPLFIQYVIWCDGINIIKEQPPTEGVMSSRDRRIKSINNKQI